MSVVPRHVLSIADLSRPDIERILGLTARCKRGRTAFARALAGKTVALVFEKPSTRTRLATEVACARLGAASVTLAGGDLQLGRGETLEDSARIFSRFVDAVCWRTAGHDRLEAFARASAVPVVNTLSDLEHPTQILSDLFTIRERRHGKRGWPALAFVGDGGNNMAHSWLLAAARLGMDLRIAHPSGYAPDPAVLRRARAEAARTGARLTVTRDPAAAATGAGVLYTDVWVSMGQDAGRAARLKAFRGYGIDRRLLARAAAGAFVMHCLPAHRGEEIAADVMDGPRSVVWDQAENRVHSTAAILLWCLGTRPSTALRASA